ncbi:alpha/beta hydrolase family protein [Streptomyces sp. NPDC086549]|uniref:alpha/beta hydrolase family protein n=1 Tax=Streptomyces sp. NPDC086549 TaxID=3365752 RepID=UPI0038222FAF
MVKEDEGPGGALLEALQSPLRVQAAHRHGTGLLLEAELLRANRRDLVPFVLGYGARDDGGWTLRHAHAAAAEVTVTADGGYLFLSDLRPKDRPGHRYGGRSLWHHHPGARPEPRLLLGTPVGVTSYAAGATAAVAAVWLKDRARTLAEDAALRAHEPAAPSTATLVEADLWPLSAYHRPGETLRLLRLGHEPGRRGGPEVLALPLGPGVRLTGELALTPDGLRCAAGLARFLRGGHRRHGLLLFSVRRPRDAREVWFEDDLSEPVPSPDGAWFACTAERVARPGRGPRREAALVAADGSAVVRAAPGHPDWLRPRAWAGRDALLCVGEQDGRRRLWHVDPYDGSVEAVPLAGSAQHVTATDGEALVVQSAVDLPPEVVAPPLGTRRRAERGRPGRYPPPPALFSPAGSVSPTGRVERLTHRETDGSDWRSLLCLPREPAERPLPVLVWCHGGPLLSWTDWSWRWNPWPFVAEGYAVLMPDPPLSVGYGQRAVERGWGRWTSEVAAVAARQVRSALDDPRLDGRRVAAMGASFGGYLALALATLLPEVRLVLSHAGWADFAAVARGCDLHWHWLREYGPVDTAPGYRTESLDLTALDPGVRVLLSHGCDDPHVPVGESRAMHRSLDGHGVAVELMLLPGEAHAIRRPDNLTAWSRWILRACRSVLATPYPPEEALIR